MSQMWLSRGRCSSSAALHGFCTVDIDRHDQQRSMRFQTLPQRCCVGHTSSERSKAALLYCLHLEQSNPAFLEICLKPCISRQTLTCRSSLRTAGTRVACVSPTTRESPVQVPDISMCVPHIPGEAPSNRASPVWLELNGYQVSI